MLFLDRKIGESIVVNREIVITVTQVKGQRVRLSFTYPSTTEVLRQELLERIEEENQKALFPRENSSLLEELPSLASDLSPHSG